MKGLLLKDAYQTWCYIRWIILVSIAMMLVGTFFMKDGSNFFVLYSGIMLGMLPMTLLAYDQNSRFSAYCAALPVTKEQIVGGKYLIGLCGMALAELLSMAALAAAQLLWGTVTVQIIVATLLQVAMLTLLGNIILLPLTYRFGYQKARYVYYLCIGLLGGFMGYFVSSGDSALDSILPAQGSLLVLVVVIAGYALTLRHEDASGQMRTGLEGLRYYLTPHMEGLTVSRFLQILLDAMSQLFFSLSVSMGIMITYGSYVKPDVDLNKAVNQIEIFDTGVALLAGAMIIPAVYVFSGTEGMSAGPSLMFVSLPKVFAAMGKAGTFVGILFFVTAIFATLTSCISVLESITANCMEIFHSGRKKTVLVLTVIYLAASAIIALGYSIFYFEVQLPNGSAAQLLDIMDYVSNSVMMPFIALLSTILIGWVMTPDYVIDEMQRGGKAFRRKKLYRVMIRYVAPVMMLVLFLSIHRDPCLKGLLFHVSGHKPLHSHGN